MKVRYRMIDQGRVIKEQTVEMDGSWEDNAKAIESDQHDGVDVLTMAGQGKSAYWIEATEV